jgi:hypothetical protein
LKKFKVGDIVVLPSQEESPVGYIIEEAFNKVENQIVYKIRWFDGWRDTWHGGSSIKQVKNVDQIPDR